MARMLPCFGHADKFKEHKAAYYFRRGYCCQLVTIIAKLQLRFLTIVGSLKINDNAVEFMLTNPADMVLLNIDKSINRGCDLEREIKENFPKVRVLIRTTPNRAYWINERLATPADGFVLKRKGIKQLLKAMLIVAHGSQYLDRTLVSNFIFKPDPAAKGPADHEPTMSDLELQIIQQKWIAQKDIKSIAAEMHIPRATLVEHMQRIIAKLSPGTLPGIYNDEAGNEFFRI